MCTNWNALYAFQFFCAAAPHRLGALAQVALNPHFRPGAAIAAMGLMPPISLLASDCFDYQQSFHNEHRRDKADFRYRHR